MEPVRFETLWGGTIVVPGMLVFADTARQQVARIKEFVKNEKGEVTALLLESSEGRNLRLPVQDSAGPIARDPQSLANRVPERFRSLVSRAYPANKLMDISERFKSMALTLGGTVTFLLGGDVIFTNEEEIRKLTRHTEKKCIGAIQMIDEAGMLYVSFTANPSSEAPRQWFFRMKPEEIWMITEQRPIGESGLVLRVESVYGEAVCEIQLDAPPSAP